MKPAILFRSDRSREAEEERAIAEKYFFVCGLRTDVPHDSLVVARYSCLPYYRELELDLAHKGSRLINSWPQHRWIADFDYYEELKEFTPRSWTDRNFYLCDHPGPFVLKGATNSRKRQWRSHMYAETKQDAIRVASELANDSLIGPQGIIYREYVKLKTYEIDPICGLPITNEWRFFFIGDKLVSYGYYWSTATDPSLGIIFQEGIDFAKSLAKIVAQHTTFFVLDIAEKEDGGWILIEVNDGQMSGLSETDPNFFYNSLRTVLRAHGHSDHTH